MNLSNVFAMDGLPVGRTFFLAWITATLLHIQWGVNVQFQDVSYMEFILQAGMLFGYFSALKYGIILSTIFLVWVFENRQQHWNPLINYSADKNKFLSFLSSYLINNAIGVLEIFAMFLAFILYSEKLVNIIAPLGLIIVLIHFSIRKSKNE